MAVDNGTGSSSSPVPPKFRLNGNRIEGDTSFVKQNKRKRSTVTGELYEKGCVFSAHPFNGRSAIVKP
jgi:hypothetical protein